MRLPIRRRPAASFNPYDWPDRLNLGCGWDLREGYLNVDLHDFHKPDLVADVTKLDELPDGHYQEIVAQDVLEHLPRASTADILRRWGALLRPGGMLILRVPSVVDLARLLERPEYQSREMQETLMQNLFGTQAYDGDYHLTSFTRPLLGAYLAEAGLTPVRWELKDEWLFDVQASRTEAPQASAVSA